MKSLTCIDEDKREDYILENMIYLNDINDRNITISKRIFNYKIPDKHIFLGGFLDINLAKISRSGKLIIVGNPPYNDEFGKGVKPIYNLFIEKCIDSCRILSFVIPAKWFVGTGKGLQSFKKMMLSRSDILCIKEFKNSKDVFPDIKLEGGVCYFVKDGMYDGECDFNGRMINLNDKENLISEESDSIIAKVRRDSILKDIYRNQSYYNIQSNDSRLQKEKEKDCIKCYTSKFQGGESYIKKSEIKKEIDKYKVLTVSANGNKPHFGRTFIAYPNEVHSKSFISFYVNTENEAKSLLLYLNTKFANYLLSLKKITQQISANTIEYIPLVPLSHEDGDIVEWDDDMLFEYFKLTDEERQIILNYSEVKNAEKISKENSPKNTPEEEITKDKLEASRGRGGYSRDRLINECKKREIKVLTKYTKSQIVDLLLESI